MRFWDSSAIVPLVVEERETTSVRQLLAEDRSIAVWWGTEIELASAIARRERETALAPDFVLSVAARFGDLARDWYEIAASREIRETAKRLVRLHALTAADALQLAAGISLAESEPSSLSFVTLDRRLRDAASRQGFTQILP